MIISIKIIITKIMRLIYFNNNINDSNNNNQNNKININYYCYY